MFKFTVKEAMADSFLDNRSNEYRLGFKTMMEWEIQKTPRPLMPYVVSTAQADAYYAGEDDAKKYYLAKMTR